jgi:parvulin-like peptidyl-prolyl cis-trans isomerase-like protein
MNVLRDPLVHFTVAAGLLFAGYQFLGRSETSDSPRDPVRIGEGEIRWLQQTFTNQWQRAPTPDELTNLATNLLEEELFAREARALGLDENDTIVRRRLAQKLDFLVNDTSRIAEPSEADLQRFYAEHADLFETVPTISFRHIYFSHAKRTDAQGDAKAALVLIANGDTPPGDIGDSLLVDAEFNDIDLQTVSNLFGPDFAKAAFVMTPGKWEGPVPSGFGLHLVQVTKSRPAEARPFETARKEVVSEWRRQKELEIRAAYVAKLKEKYGVDIDDSVKPLIAPGPLLGPSQ